MELWVQEGLSRILNFEVPDDLIQYIKSIDSERDLNEYMRTLLDFDNNQHKNFFLELSKRKFPNKGSSLPKQVKKKISKNKQQEQAISSQAHVEPPPLESNTDSEARNKKKIKYINMYSQEGKNAQVVLLKGRHRCECQASKHELVHNCVQCGRVVCRQEGSGPCLFCGTLVCTPQEQRELNAKTKASGRLRQALMDRSLPAEGDQASAAAASAALLHRNRLLEYDRTSERRTRVTDDDSDYFNANSVWLEAGEKEKLDQYQRALHEKKHASRLSKKMTFDFAGRQIVEDNTIDYGVDEDKIREMSASGGVGSVVRPSERSGGGGAGAGLPADRDVAPGVNAPLLQFDPSVESQQIPVRAVELVHYPRVQDAEIQEMSDTGRCLSMHQPWASLLVEGIKMHEGRTWYTSHRGRLWIAATVKPPDQAVVSALEEHYRALYPEKNFKFPTFYPTGCLLGCVNVDECLPQEEYAKKYPGGGGWESDSPYVFICSNPVSLRLRFPVRGEHKIYALDKTIHFAAQKSILKMAKMQVQQANAA